MFDHVDIFLKDHLNDDKLTNIGFTISNMLLGILIDSLYVVELSVYTFTLLLFRISDKFLGR